MGQRHKLRLLCQELFEPFIAEPSPSVCWHEGVLDSAPFLQIVERTQDRVVVPVRGDRPLPLMERTCDCHVQRLCRICRKDDAFRMGDAEEAAKLLAGCKDAARRCKVPCTGTASRASGCIERRAHGLGDAGGMPGRGGCTVQIYAMHGRLF